jgi:hypothetical protein
MDHKQIEESDLVDRYLMGKLAPDDSAQFEEHFVDCAQCVDRLSTTKDLIEGLRVVAARQSVEREDYRAVPIHWHSRFGLSPNRIALASGVVLLLALASAGIMSNRVRLSRTEADQARSDSAEWQRRYQEERESASLADSKHQETERGLTGRVTELEAELDNSRKQEPGELAPGYGRATQPQVNVAIVMLNATRGSDPRSATNEVRLPRSPTNFVISLALEGEPGHVDYRVTLLGDQGQVIWKGGGFTPDSHDSLTVGLNSSFFRPGDYRLRVEGVGSGGSASVVGEYHFRVIKNS